MRVIIPVAGLGSRLKPHTFTTPKPLMDVAGRPILEYIVKEVEKLNPTEIIFIVGHKRKSIEKYIERFHAHLNVSFVEQKVKDGDGSAIRLGLENLDISKNNDEELMIIFGDTLIDFDIKGSIEENTGVDSLIFGMEVKEPKHYGIMNIDEGFNILEVEEKPENPKSNLAIIGAYYFKSSLMVKKSLDNFYKKKETITGEYKIVQVIEEYIENEDLTLKASKVKEWFDCGRPQVLLEANKYFLEKMSDGEIILKGSCLIIPPSFVSRSAVVKNSVIGPYASVGKDAVISDSIIKDSVVNIGANIENQNLEKSLIGKEVSLKGRTLKINIGDKSEIHLN